MTKFKDICYMCKKDIPASGGLTFVIGKLSLCYDCYLEFPKGEKKMRTEKQIRAELKHQKSLAAGNTGSFILHETYMTRVHLLSWVLGDSTTF